VDASASGRSSLAGASLRGRGSAWSKACSRASSGFSNGKTLIYSGIPAGSWVGEGLVLKRELRHYDIVAVQPSRTVHIPRTTFHWLLDTSVKFDRFVLDHLNERLGQQILDLQALDGFVRLAL
jgi:CRP-like cAMP-binding protein